MNTTVELYASNRILVSRELRRAAGIARRQKLIVSATPGRIVLERGPNPSGSIMKRGKLKVWRALFPPRRLRRPLINRAITPDDLPGHRDPGGRGPETHPEHHACLAAVEDSDHPFTNARALAEMFATLTGFYKVPNQVAAELTLSLRESIRVESLALAGYETAIGEARSRGVLGGGIYDSLHATYARRKKAACIVTRNPSHFHDVASDIKILTL